MRALVRRHQIVSFYVLVLALTWGPALTVARSSGLPQIGVSLAGLGVLLLVGSRRGAWEHIRKHALRWRVRPKWYAVSILTPVAITSAAAGISSLLGGHAELAAWVTDPATVGLAVAVTFLLPVGPMGEELLGWRGVALPALQRTLGPWAASLAIGVSFGLWHFPEYLRPGSSQHALGLGFLVPFVLLLLASSIVQTWIFNRTGGSALVAGWLWHASFNTCSALVLVQTEPRTMTVVSADSQLTFVWLALVAALAVALLAATGGRLGVDVDRASERRDQPLQTTLAVDRRDVEPA